ncbi:MAG: hypothetical protein WCI79_00840 [Candidatus Saccharibacteria bacterium]
MENDPDSTTAPLSPEEDKKEWSAFKKKIAALAITLTMMFSAGATIAANEKGVKSELENNDSTKVNVGLHDIKPGPETIPGFGVSIPTGEDNVAESLTEQKVIETEVQLMKYARLFDADPAALEINGLDMIPGVADQIIALQANGFTINKISVIGHASDEAISKGDGSGLGRNDIENVRLADKRGHAGDDLLAEALTQKIGAAEAQKLADVTVVEKGIEVRDDAQAEAIDKMAESLNMTTVELIGKYNTHPETLSPEAKEVLDGLKSDRFVRFVIESSREVTDENGDKSTEIVIIPILIPVFKRRKKEPEPGPEPEPTPGTQPNPEPEPFITYGPRRIPLVGTVHEGPYVPVIDKPEPAPVFKQPESTPTPDFIPPVSNGYQSQPKDAIFNESAKSQPGYGTVTERINQPDTSNAHYDKGSGGMANSRRHTTHRGNSH